MQYHAPSQCPVCSGTMAVTRLHCPQCGTELTGSFSPCRFCTLEEKHMQFVETFLRCRGSIKEMEKALGVSYPTVKNMMDAALRALGMQEEPQAADSLRQKDIYARRASILDLLESGEIDVDAAIDALRQEKGE